MRKLIIMIPEDELMLPVFSSESSRMSNIEIAGTLEVLRRMMNVRITQAMITSDEKRQKEAEE